MGAFAQRGEEQDLLLGDLQALAEGGDVGGDQRRLGAGQRQPDVGGAQHVLGQPADGGAQLHAEHGSAQGLEHALSTAHHGAHLLGDLLDSAAVIALPTLSATGSVRDFHTGMVFSTHSAREKARHSLPSASNTVAASSHISASLAALATAEAREAEIEGSSEAMAWRAESVAIFQFTGPPSPLDIAAIIAWACAIICAMASGLLDRPMASPSPCGKVLRVESAGTAKERAEHLGERVLRVLVVVFGVVGSV